MSMNAQSPLLVPKGWDLQLHATHEGVHLTLKNPKGCTVFTWMAPSFDENMGGIREALKYADSVENPPTDRGFWEF